MHITGQIDDPAARAFCEFGLSEPLRHGDAAGRYIARETGKEYQKQLPPEYAGLGRWWYLAPHLRPLPRSRGFVSMDDWPFKQPYSVVWEANKLNDAVVAEWGWQDEAERQKIRDTVPGPLHIVERTRIDQAIPPGEHVPTVFLPTDCETAELFAEIWPTWERMD